MTAATASQAPARPPAAKEARLPRIALVGCPNTGKTTLFNALTGLRAKTGNYPGVTVDRREGTARVPGGAVCVIDLPGLYSLHAISEDEAVTVRVLRGELLGRPPDAVVIVADATTLERSLPVIAEVLQVGLPACVALTMVDELKARGGELDLFQLQRALGVPVVGVVGNRGIGLDDLRARMAECARWPAARNLPPDDTEARFRWADALLRRCARARPAESRLTRRLDAVLLHPVAGPLVFLAFIAVFFQAIFTWAQPAMDFMSGWMDQAAAGLAALLPAGVLSGLLADGIVRGVGSVIAFLPQIALLFLVIFFLEACGYMARAAFVVDRLMGVVGLEGRCFIALLSSYACAVPGILATRTIPSPRDRLATILAAPFMTCSARLPVYALLIAAFIPSERVLGPFTWQGLTLFGLYFLGSASAFLIAAVLKRGVLRGAALPFYLELPPYRFPSPRVVLLQVWRRLALFLRRAGTIILAVSVLLWFLLHFPQRLAPAGATPAQQQQHVIENSYGAHLGRTVEPLFRPLGFDWRVCVGLIGAQAAREVMVTTMAQVYATPIEDEAHAASLAQTLATPDPETGRPPLDRAAALALLVYFVYSLQCISTLVVMRRETGGWKWPAVAFTYSFVLAWVAAFATYRIAS
ncbi:MAG: ferrous iron transporter B [Planctomycetota bacterium]|nr:MAG: ferrous iron transporter B [Planctomycetota bacterium]